MIELIAAAVSGAVVGGGVVWWQMRDAVIGWHTLADIRADEAWYAVRTLTALRSNCFIHNEKGHFTPYSQASVERRVKAETPKEVV